MGAYINPPDMTKEEWLEQNARPVDEPHEFVGDDERLVILVDNGLFTAAAIAHNEKEFDYFIDLGAGDARPRRYFIATIADLLPVSDLGQYL